VATNIVPDRASFVGRDRELEALARHIDDGRQLVTILGPRGVGKTRLARTHATTTTYAGSAWLCDLAQASGPLSVLAAVAAGLSITIGPGDDPATALARVAEAVTDRTLIILDNAEHLTAVVAELASQLVRHAPSIQLIVTSRERLRVPEEHVLELSPLDADAAYALFIDRARAARGAFSPAEDEAEAVQTICRRLDHLPLAIELAAARVRIMTATELAQRLVQRLDLVSDAAPDLHSTLMATIRWSWTLLDDDERHALACCAVFEGGWSLEAAEAVVDRVDALELVQALRDKSLLAADEIAELGQLRFSILDSVRAFAAEHVPDGAELRHARHYVQRGFQWAARAEGRQGRRARVHLSLEQPNLLAVHRRALAAEQPEHALRAAVALQPVLITRGPMPLRMRLLSEALDLAAIAPDVPPRWIGWALLSRADAHFVLGELDASQSDFEDALIWASEDEDPRLRGQLLWRLGSAALSQDHLQDAETKLEAALDIFERVGDRIHEARVLLSLARARRDPLLAGEAVKLSRAAGDRRYEAAAWLFMAAVMHDRGDDDKAGRFAEEARAAYIEVSHHPGRAAALSTLGLLAADSGDEATAAEHFAEARRHLRHTPNRQVEAQLDMRQAFWSEIEHARAQYQRAIEAFADLGSPRRALLARACWLIAELDAGHREQAEAMRAHLVDEGSQEWAEASEVARLALVALDGGTTLHADVESAWVRRVRARVERWVGGEHAPDALVIGDGWFKPPHAASVNIAARRAPRRVLVALAQLRVVEPGRSLSVSQLFDAGWPGELALESAAKSRVYVAVSTLRKRGLEPVLQKTDDGYRLDPETPMVLDGV